MLFFWIINWNQTQNPQKVTDNRFSKKKKKKKKNTFLELKLYELKWLKVLFDH